MWLDWLVFCDYGFSESALWCPFATATVLLGFLVPWTWGISSRLLQQSAATAPYFGRQISPHCCPSWPWTWRGSSWPSCARAAMAPWMWGCSSRPPPLTSQPSGATLCPRSGAAAERSYPLPKARGGGWEEIARNTWKNAQHCSLLENVYQNYKWGITSYESEWPSSKNLQAINVGEAVEK